MINLSQAALGLAPKRTHFGSDVRPYVYETRHATKGGLPVINLVTKYNFQLARWVQRLTSRLITPGHGPKSSDQPGG